MKPKLQELTKFALDMPPKNMSRLKPHNAKTWARIARLYETQDTRTLKELEIAASGHKHGTQSSYGRGPGDFIDYCLGNHWLKVVN